ncbi:MAG: hypothetical protein JWO86_1964 [Myxococcaceae bacterium]|nr:hypothetical protein [Myxococcaceae bacterium]
MRGLLKLRALLSSSILSAAVLAACTGAACSTAAGTTDDAALASKATLDTNDVSFLVPLPNTVDEPALVQLKDAPSLLAFERFTGFLGASGWTPLIDPIAPPMQRAIYDSLRVVAVRLDPCFPGFNPGESACRPQLRLVMQSVTAQPNSEDVHQIKAGDATLHFFYELTASELRDVVIALRTWKAQAPAMTAGKPLGVHPRLQQEGMQGTLADELRSLILAKCREANLSRIAFMMLQFGPLSSFPNQWTFGAADVVNGAFVPAKLAHLKEEASSQLFIMRRKKEAGDDTGPPQVDPNSLAGIFLPESSAPDNASFFLQSDNYLAQPRTADVTTAMKALLRVENPHLDGPGSVDCVSCHVATPLRLFAERNGISTQGAEYMADRYQPVEGANADLRTMQASTVPDREIYTTVNFGYFDLQPSISQRTVNESAEVANAINAMKL